MTPRTCFETAPLCDNILTVEFFLIRTKINRPFDYHHIRTIIKITDYLNDIIVEEMAHFEDTLTSKFPSWDRLTQGHRQQLWSLLLIFLSFFQSVYPDFVSKWFLRNNSSPDKKTNSAVCANSPMPFKYAHRTSKYLEQGLGVNCISNNCLVTLAIIGNSRSEEL